MSELPSGLVSILFTDIENSTSHWDNARDAMRQAHTLHNELLTRAFTQHGGTVVKDKGDGFIVVFSKPLDAIAAAAAAQRSLGTARWPDVIDEIRARMAINTALLEPENGDYYGPEVNKVARMEASAHGGQILLSDSTRALCEGQIPDGLSLQDLGLQRLRGVSHPERVFGLVGAGLLDGFPELDTSADRGHPLPNFDNTFVGRGTEIKALQTLIDGGSRLVTVLGPGGIGKSRLAVETARSIARSMPGGSHFADLAPLDSSDQVSRAVAESLGVHAEGSAEVLALVAERITTPTLIVIDNFEHVMQASRSIGDLLANSSTLTAIVTSRQPLGLRNESLYHLDPLDVAANGGRSPAVELFYDRVASQGVVLTDADLPLVASICRRLDGLPLAIELVAPRARLVSIHELDQMLEQSIDALGSGGADLPERHRTMRNAIEWSLKELSESQRLLFSRLAALPAGATLKMLERICCFDLEGSPLQNVATLVDNSLVDAVTDLAGGTRFRQLAPLREYGIELLQAGDEYGRAMGRLVDYYVEEAPRLGIAMQFDSTMDEMVTVDQPNVLAAMRWSLQSGRVEDMAEVTKQMWVYWFKGDRIGPAVDWVAEADKKLKSPVLDWLAGFLAFQQGDFETVFTRMAKARAGFEEADDDLGLALALTFGATVIEDPEQAHSMLDRALGLFGSGSPVGEFMAVVFKSIVDFQTGDIEASLRRRESALASIDDIGLDELTAWARWNLAWAYYAVGEFSEALSSFGFAFEYMAADGYQEGVASSAEGVALIDIAAGNVERGLRTLGGASAAFERIGTVSWMEAGFHVGQNSESLSAEIGQSEFDRLIGEGRSLTFDGLIDVTREALEQLLPNKV
ncbi:MAG: AAA family ATPase [Acidimicrobiia bacterium]